MQETHYFGIQQQNKTVRPCILQVDVVVRGQNVSAVINVVGNGDDSFIVPELRWANLNTSGQKGNYVCLCVHLLLSSSTRIKQTMRACLRAVVLGLGMCKIWYRSSTLFLQIPAEKGRQLAKPRAGFDLGSYSQRFQGGQLQQSTHENGEG